MHRKGSVQPKLVVGEGLTWRAESNVRKMVAKAISFSLQSVWNRVRVLRSRNIARGRKQCFKLKNRLHVTQGELQETEPQRAPKDLSPFALQSPAILVKDIPGG